MTPQTVIFRMITLQNTQKILVGCGYEKVFHLDNCLSEMATPKTKVWIHLQSQIGIVYQFENKGYQKSLYITLIMCNAIFISVKAV